MKEFLVSPMFYGFYIGIMFIIFISCYVKVFIPYRSSKRAAGEIEDQLKKLSEVSDEVERISMFTDWVSKSTNSYVKKCLNPAWEHYYKKYMEYRQSGTPYTPDVYEFLFEEQFVNEYGRRKFAEIVGGIFLSMGIIGTFIGIATGVSNLNMNNGSAAMQTGIDGLLKGMQVKFLSSIFGISLSLAWQWMDKGRFYPTLTKAFSRIRRNLDEAFPTQDQSTLLFSLDQRQEKQMQDFQSFLSEILIPKMVSGVTDSIQQAIAPQMEQTQRIVSELVQTTSVNQAQGMQDMVNQFVTQLNELTGDHMKNLGEALNSTLEWQQKVHVEMAALVQSMQESAVGQSMMADKTTSLAGQIHSYTEQITNYQSVLEKTVSELNESSDKNSRTQSVTADLLDKMMEERRLFNDYFEKHLSSLKDNVDCIQNHTEMQINFQNRFDESLQRISNITHSQETLAITLSHQAELSQRSNQELETIFDKFTSNNKVFVHLQEDLQVLFQNIQEERREIDDVSERLQDTLVDQMSGMDERVESLHFVWSSASESLAKTNKHLETSMNQFTDDMHRGLQNTFIQFDQELTKSVQHLASGVDAIQEGLIDLPDAMQTLKQAIHEINRQSKRLVNPVTTE